MVLKKSLRLVHNFALSIFASTNMRTQLHICGLGSYISGLKALHSYQNTLYVHVHIGGKLNSTCMEVIPYKIVKCDAT